MDDNRLVSIAQPTRFRANELQPPDWAHFPKLRLLLGWGPGIRETFGPAITGLRTVIIPEQADVSRPPLRWLITAYDEHFLFRTRLYENAPQLNVFSAGQQRQRFCLNHGGLYKVDLDPESHGLFPICAAPDFGVSHSVDEQGSLFVFCRRVKRLKAKYQERMKQLGLVYERGTGRRSRNADGMRTPSEQRFADILGAIKQSHAEKRARELEKNPGIRPLDFDDLRRAHIRARLGEIERRKRDREGRGKRPYTEEALLRRTCVEIARRESDDDMYDFSWVDQRSFRPARSSVPAVK